MTIFRIGRTKAIVSKIPMGRALLSAPAAVKGTLYVATSGAIYAISGR